MNKDQKAGRIKEVKGTVKEVAGRITGDKTLENKGKVQNAVGETQSAFGDAKADSAAKKLLQQVFKDRVIEQLRMDGVAAGGGSVHCATRSRERT